MRGCAVFLVLWTIQSVAIGEVQEGTRQIGKDYEYVNSELLQLVRRLNQQIAKQQVQIESQKQQMAAQQEETNKRLEMLEAGGNRGSLFPERAHAFYARKTNNMERVSLNTIIVYENVVLNHGGFYNAVVGQYIIPIPGIYVFMMNGLTNMSNSQVQLILNRQEISRTHATYAGSNQAMGMMAVLNLQPNSEVHTVLLSSFSLRGGGYSHFGGFLVAG